MNCNWSSVQHKALKNKLMSTYTSHSIRTKVISTLSYVFIKRADQTTMKCHSIHMSVTVQQFQLSNYVFHYLQIVVGGTCIFFGLELTGTLPARCLASFSVTCNSKKKKVPWRWLRLYTNTSKKSAYCSFSWSKFISLTAWGWLLQYCEYTLNSCCYYKDSIDRLPIQSLLTYIEDEDGTYLRLLLVVHVNLSLKFMIKISLKFEYFFNIWEDDFYSFIIK